MPSLPNTDTIAALATPVGVGALGIVRVSGPRAHEVAASIFAGATPRPYQDWPPQRARFGRIRDPRSGLHLDQAILLPYRAPASFTGEDMVEITCHGGPTPLRAVLGLLLRLGARLAEPGEFTRRAFLNGRIDLAQAEAVMDTIAARSTAALTVAVEQMEGRLSRRLQPLRARLLEIRAAIEAAIDFPDDVEDPPATQLRADLEAILGATIETLRTADAGLRYREGVHVVITGKPNVGKSTLMNALLRDARAIVTDIPGTTRDTLEESLTLRGVPLRLTDTAGLRETEDPVESIGVERARAALRAADLVLLVLDRSRPLTEDDGLACAACEGKPALYLVNKADLPAAWSMDDLQTLCPGVPPANSLGSRRVLVTSLAQENGPTEVERALEAMLVPDDISPSEVYVSSLRHRQALEACADSLRQALLTLEEQQPLDLLTTDLTAAAQELGTITGESVTEETISAIFARFCVGK